MQTHQRRLWHTAREYLTHWSVAGAILALTGAAPEHWFADLVHALPLRLAPLPLWLEHVDYRLVAVIVGLSVVVGDNLWRHHGRPALTTFEPAVPVTLEALPEFEAAQPGADPPSVEIARPAPRYEQDIHFCMTGDGVQLAYSRMGSGPPLVKTGNWLTHLEFDFESPIWRHLFAELARDHTLVRYDARGNGLSDRDIEDVSFEAFVNDLEAVVDAADLERFALFGISQGCAVSIAYAIRHPERVSHMILLGGFVVGRTKRAQTDAEKEQQAAMLALLRLGWGQKDSTFRQLFTSRFVPGATREQADWFNELQRISASPEDAARNFISTGNFDVSTLLGQVSVPTLVLHARDDASAPFDQGRRLAAGIPGARFVPLVSRNHLILEDEPAFPRFLEEVRGFLAT
jgi:pimeloyl-ACP methyl ester carboxylesterase